MDEPTPPQSAEPDPAPATEPAVASEPAPPSARDERIQARLQEAIEVPDPILAWSRGWVSRETRLPELLAARTLDYAVLTDRSLHLVTNGFFTRLPRRRVYSARLTDISAWRARTPGGRRLQITTDEGNPLRIELRANDRGKMFAAAVIARVRAERAQSPE